MCDRAWSLFFVSVRGKNVCAQFSASGEGIQLKHFDAYKALVVYDLIAVLVHEKSVPFLSCHPVVIYLSI